MGAVFSSQPASKLHMAKGARRMAEKTGDFRDMGRTFFERT